MLYMSTHMKQAALLWPSNKEKKNIVTKKKREEKLKSALSK